MLMFRCHAKNGNIKNIFNFGNWRKEAGIIWLEKCSIIVFILASFVLDKNPLTSGKAYF